jgi:hypothetical protein
MDIKKVKLTYDQVSVLFKLYDDTGSLNRFIQRYHIYDLNYNLTDDELIILWQGFDRGIDEKR